MSALSRNDKLLKRKRRVRKKISGTAEIPRLSVHKSLKHIYAQAIDDVTGKTIESCSSLSKGIEKGTKSDIAKAVGKTVAEKILKKGINTVKFDRGGHKYHGRVKKLGDAAREGGLKF